MNSRKYAIIIGTTGMAILVLAGCGNTPSNNTTSTSPTKQTASSTSVSYTVNSTSSSNNVTSETSSSVLPSSFRTYQDVWNSMGPYLDAHTSAQVWLPTMKDVLNFAPKPWMNVQYSVNQTGYTLSVSVGPKLPPNSPKIMAGNAEIIYTITALNKNEPVPQNVNWDNTSAVIPDAEKQSVNLGHGITGTMYTGKLDGINRRDIVWEEDGWTFGWESETDESVKTTIGYAEGMMADDNLNKSLPIKSGYFLSGEGSGGPSQVEFVVGNTRYIMYAPGGRALQIMASMVHVQ